MVVTLLQMKKNNEELCCNSELQQIGNDDDRKRSAGAIDNLQCEAQVMMKKGDEVDKDVTCDSAFMLDTTPNVVKAMQKKFHWIPQTEKTHSVMDNAGGHGTDATKETHANVSK